MQALFDFIAGLLSAVAAIAFAQFGVALHGASQPPAHPAEVHRTVHPTERHAEMVVDRPHPCPRMARPA